MFELIRVLNMNGWTVAFKPSGCDLEIIIRNDVWFYNQTFEHRELLSQHADKMIAQFLQGIVDRIRAKEADRRAKFSEFSGPNPKEGEQ